MLINTGIYINNDGSHCELTNSKLRSDKSVRSDSKEEYISDGKLVTISSNNKVKPLEMTNEQYNSWTGNEKEIEI